MTTFTCPDADRAYCCNENRWSTTSAVVDESTNFMSFIAASSSNSVEKILCRVSYYSIMTSVRMLLPKIFIEFP